MSDWLKRLFFGAVWRLYQIILLPVGMLLFYRVFGDASDKTHPLLWILLAATFGFLLALLVTILTGRALDRFNATRRNRPPNQVDGGLRDNTASPESLHRLGTLEKPDDFITLSPSTRKHPR